MKKYRLKKDLPGSNAGTIVMSVYWLGKKNCSGEFTWVDYNEAGMDHFPDWFEPLQERWRPKEGDKVYYIGQDGFIGTSKVKNWGYVSSFVFRIENGGSDGRYA